MREFDDSVDLAVCISVRLSGKKSLRFFCMANGEFVVRKDLDEGSGNSTIASAVCVSFLLCDDAIDFNVDGGLNPRTFMHFSETKSSQGGCGGDDGDTSLFNVA